MLEVNCADTQGSSRSLMRQPRHDVLMRIDLAFRRRDKSFLLNRPGIPPQPRRQVRDLLHKRHTQITQVPGLIPALPDMVLCTSGNPEDCALTPSPRRTCFP